VHVFVDESRRGRIYLVAAALVAPAQLAETRSLMRSLSMPGERRIHFQAEHDSRRRKILAALVAGRTQAHVYLGTGRPEQVRTACLTALIADAGTLGTSRLVIESRGPMPDRRDRATIHQALASRSPWSSFSYEHLCPHDDPILAVADAVAWAHGAGGDWRRRIEPVVAKVIDLGKCP
jgi:hypothetical protein